MRYEAFFLWSLLLCIAAHAHGGETWRYPGGGPGSEGHVSTGRLKRWGTFSCQTTDPVEKVLVWYAERTGFDLDSSFIQEASTGFKSNNQQYGILITKDTREDRRVTYLIADVSDEKVIATFVHRPDYESRQHVVITVSGTPEDATIHVVETESD